VTTLSGEDSEENYSDLTDHSDVDDIGDTDDLDFSNCSEGDDEAREEKEVCLQELRTESYLALFV